jgi:hypothetical protein
MAGVSLVGLATDLKHTTVLSNEHDEGVAHPRIECSLS